MSDNIPEESIINGVRVVARHFKFIEIYPEATYDDHPLLVERNSEIGQALARIIMGYETESELSARLKIEASRARGSRREWIDALTMALGTRRDREHLYNDLDTARAAAAAIGLIVACAEEYADANSGGDHNRFERACVSLGSAVDALRALDTVRRERAAELRKHYSTADAE